MFVRDIVGVDADAESIMALEKRKQQCTKALERRRHRQKQQQQKTIQQQQQQQRQGAEQEQEAAFENSHEEIMDAANVEGDLEIRISDIRCDMIF
jgi:transcription initiation factor TFIID subunit TAF12